MKTKTPETFRFRNLSQSLAGLEASLTRRENVLNFLIIRFVLMSGMVLAFAWTFLQFSP